MKKPPADLRRKHSRALRPHIVSVASPAERPREFPTLGQADTISPAAIAVLPDETAFGDELQLLIPQIRAYSRSIAPRADADDLMQDALIRAWTFRAKYQPGTNLKAWVFTILRNLWLSGLRRSWRTQPMDPEIAESTIPASDNPSASEELLDVINAMDRLPNQQREALIMVGLAGLSYKIIAEIWGCAEGTVKSRVSRARQALTDILERSETGPRPRSDVSSTEVFEEIMQDAMRLRSRLALV